MTARSRRSPVRDRRGAVAVEFALLVPITLMMLIGTMEVGKVMWTRGAVQFAAEETARWAAVRPTAPITDVEEQARGRLPDALSAETDVEVERTADAVRVTVRTPVRWVVPFFGADSWTVEGTSTSPLSR